MASVFFSFSSQVSLSSAISFSDIYNQDKKNTFKSSILEGYRASKSEKKCDFVNIRKNKMKKSPLPKIRLIVQIGGYIQAPVCSDDSIPILLRFAWILTSTFPANFKSRVFIWSHWRITLLLSPRQFAPTADFWQVNIFHHVVSGYANQSHDFTNLVFAT